MKKLLAIITVIFLLSVSAIPCLAAEYTEGESAVISVTAKFISYDDPNLYTDTADGGYSVTTSDGRTITVTGAVPDGAVLVVRQVTKDDAKAWEWFASCTANIGGNIIPFDIYFVDENGNKITVTGEITVTVTLPNGYKTPVVCYLSTDGSTTMMGSSEKNGTLTFKTTHNSYYVVAEKAGGSPQTGDNSHMGLWLVLLLVSGGTVVFTVARGNLKRRSADNKL